MTKFNLLYIFFAIIVFSSCEDAFNQVVEIDIPKHESKLVSYCLLDELQDTFHMDIYNSIGILEDNYDKIDNASINVTVDGNTFSPFVYDSTYYFSSFGGHWDPVKMEWVNDSLTGGAYWSPKFDLKNDKIDIEISKSGYKTIASSATIPPKPAILNVEYSETSDSIDIVTGNIIVEFDNIQSGFYYLVAIMKNSNNSTNHQFNRYNSLDIMAKDPNYHLKYLYSNLDIPSQYLTFDGQNFDTHFKASFGFNDWTISNEDDKFFIQIIAVSEDVYNFLNAIAIYSDAVDNPFAEPVVIPSNFDNGYGIFGVTRTTKVQFK